MKYGGSLPAELAEQIATKYHVGIMDVIGSPLTENPMAAYWTLTLPNGIKVAIAEQQVYYYASTPGGPPVTAAQKYAYPPPGTKQCACHPADVMYDGPAHVCGPSAADKAALAAKIKKAAAATPTVSLSPEVIKAMADSVDKATYKMMKEAQFAKMYGAGPVKALSGINAVLADYQQTLKAQLNAEIPMFKKMVAPSEKKPLITKMYGSDGTCYLLPGNVVDVDQYVNTYGILPHKPAYNPPTKPAKQGQQISLDI